MHRLEFLLHPLEQKNVRHDDSQCCSKVSQLMNLVPEVHDKQNVWHRALISIRLFLILRDRHSPMSRVFCTMEAHSSEFPLLDHSECQNVRRLMRSEDRCLITIEVMLYDEKSER